MGSSTGTHFNHFTRDNHGIPLNHKGETPSRGEFVAQVQLRACDGDSKAAASTRMNLSTTTTMGPWSPM